jgi:hypothetical protein
MRMDPRLVRYDFSADSDPVPVFLTIQKGLSKNVNCKELLFNVLNEQRHFTFF